MLEYGKFVVFRSDYPDLSKFKNEIIYYIDKDFPLTDMKILFERGLIEIREATEREKKLCFHAFNQSEFNLGIFINELDKYENYIAEIDC